MVRQQNQNIVFPACIMFYQCQSVKYIKCIFLFTKQLLDKNKQGWCRTGEEHIDTHTVV